MYMLRNIIKYYKIGGEMAECFSFQKAIDFSATALGKSTSTVIKGLLILISLFFSYDRN